MKATSRSSIGTGFANAFRIIACVALLAAARARDLTPPAPGDIGHTSPTTAPVAPATVAPAAKGGSETRRSSEKSPHEQRVELIGLSLGAVAVVFGCSIACLAIWTEAQKRRDLISAIHRERMAALEKGLDLPAFPSEWPSRDAAGCGPGTPSSGLKPGLMWLAAGVGLWLFLSPKNHGLLHPSVGAIPAVVGVAHLVYFAVEGRKLKRGEEGS